MKNRDQYKRLTEFIEVAIIFAIHSALYLIIWTTLYQDMTEAPLFRRGNWAIVAAYPILLFVFGKVFGAFRISSRRIDIIFSHIGTLVIVNLLSYFIIVLATRVYVTVWPLIVLFVVEVALTVIWIILVKKINLILYPVRRMLLIHGGYSYKDIVFTMNTKSERYVVKETIDADEDIEVIKGRIADYESILISDIPAQRRNDILKYCYEINKRVYMTPKLSDILIRSAGDVHVGDTQIFLLKNYGLSAEQRFIKRLFDIVVSGLMIAVSSPLMLIVAILIRAEDKGPVFYRQERYTMNARKFKIIKFRSMIVDAEKDGFIPSTEGDPRVTKVGKFIRATRIDELPQIINILKGDMSWVGPRPERTEHVEEYTKNIPEFNYRLLVRGGLTGYAQVYGKYNTTAYDKLRLDLIYIENFSILMDLRILVLTLKIIFTPEATEGFSQEDSDRISGKDE